MSPKAKSADFRNLSPDEQVRRLQQRAAELHRKEYVKYCTAQLQLHSEIVGPVQRLVDNLVQSSRTVQITSGGVATHGADCLDSTPPPHSPLASVSTFTPRTLKLQQDGAVDGEGEPAVISGLVALEDADSTPLCTLLRLRLLSCESVEISAWFLSGDHWVFLFFELSDSRSPCPHEMCFLVSG